jgi:hypothetical protein
MKMQLDILDQIRPHLDKQGQDIQSQVLEILKSKLAIANIRLDGLVTNWSSDLMSKVTPDILVITKRGKSKYVMLKNHLDETIKDVESWQTLLFNPSWFSIMKAKSQLFGIELSRAAEAKNMNKQNDMITGALAVRDPLGKAASISVFLPYEKLVTARIIGITFSSARLIQIEDGGKWRLLDSVSDLSKKATRDLAVKLKSCKPSTFGLLTCIGAIDNTTKNELSLVFRIPENMTDPTTLRGKLLSGHSNHSLSNRFQLATQLAQAVCSIHSFGLVHKSIRPENIILFQNQESALGLAFLLGFEKVRVEEGPTRLVGDTDEEKNLYRHPQRQGLKLQDSYIMQHDIYSLGVCLLEIGLWNSFVEYTNPSLEPVISQNYGFDIAKLDDTNRSETVKEKLLTLARSKLPENMGTKYSKVVETCLTCLDKDNEDFGDQSEFEDEDGILVAVRYIEKILMQLSIISI